MIAIAVAILLVLLVGGWYLWTAVAPRLGAVIDDAISVTDVQQKARRTKINADLEVLVKVAELNFVETGAYPTSIAAMVNATGPGGEPLMASLDELPKDPWGRDYEYELVDGEPRARCLGSDGIEGGEGEAADIVMPRSAPGR